MKTCTRCGVPKEESEFYRERRKFRQPCKSCYSTVKTVACRKCGTKLRAEAAGNLCGFCTLSPPDSDPVEQPTSPSAAENRARVALEQAGSVKSASKGGVGQRAAETRKARGTQKEANF